MRVTVQLHCLGRRWQERKDHWTSLNSGLTLFCRVSAKRGYQSWPLSFLSHCLTYWYTSTLPATTCRLYALRPVLCGAMAADSVDDSMLHEPASLRWMVLAASISLFMCRYVNVCEHVHVLLQEYVGYMARINRASNWNSAIDRRSRA